MNRISIPKMVRLKEASFCTNVSFHRISIPKMVRLKVLISYEDATGAPNFNSKDGAIKSSYLQGVWFINSYHFNSKDGAIKRRSGFSFEPRLTNFNSKDGAIKRNNLNYLRKWRFDFNSKDGAIKRCCGNDY